MGEVETETDEDGRNEKSGIKTSGRDIVLRKIISKGSIGKS